MSLNLHIDTTVDESRNQLLLAKQAQVKQLQEEISSLRSIPLSTSPSSSSNNGRVQKYQHVSQRRNNISRGNSNSGAAPMSRQQSSERTETLQSRSRTFSQRSAISMTRGNSKGSTSQRNGSLPFTTNGINPPPLYSRLENQSIVAWTQQEQSSAEYNLSHQPYHEQQQQWLNPPRTSGLEQVRELDDLADPSEYLRNMNTPYFVTASIPISPQYLTNHIQLPSTCTMPASSPSTSDMLTRATTFADTMSRQDSLCSEPFIEKVQMMKFGSHSSYSPEVTHDHTFYDQVNSFSPLHNQHPSNEQQFKPLFSASASHNSYISHSLPLQSALFCAEMEKSQSNESNSSSTSARKQRNIARLQNQNRLANARPLIPKGGSADNVMSRENSSQSMARLGSKDGSQDNKVAISSKPGYQRPKHDRVYCDQCDNHPEGFRGPHELSRHKDREHTSMVKKWMCIEATEGPHKVLPTVPLSRCKACNQQKKKYGAYYNAAAHLRRAHFNPKPKGRASKGSKNDDSDKRGGKGGGDFPHMDELKNWMILVEEPASEYVDDKSTRDAEEDCVDDNNNEEMDYSQQPISTLPNNGFELNFVGDISMLDCSASMHNYPTTANNYPTTINNELFDNVNMQLDFANAPQQHFGMNQVKLNTLSVQNNLSFSPDMYQHELPMFYDTSPFTHPQALENQIFAGPGAVHHY